MEADFVAYSMGIFAYMTFYWECDSTTVLGHYIESSLSIGLVASTRQCWIITSKFGLPQRTFVNHEPNSCRTLA